MDDLRALCEAAGLANVTSYLQTGNILFETEGSPDDAAALIEAALAGHGLRNVVAVVRSADELAAMIAAAPLASYAEPAFVRMVTLFRADLPPGAEDIARAKFPGAVVLGREVFWPIPGGLAGVDLGSLEKKYRVPGTTRYWRVVEEATRLANL